jgi:hypothetical protein
LIIKNILAPKVAGEHSAEEIIFRRGVGELFSELRTVITETEVLITDTPRKGGKAQIPKLPAGMNQAIGESLRSLGWEPRTAPGAVQKAATSDWTKFRPSGLKYMSDLGIAVEVQFGHHYQFNADVQRFAEAILEGKIVAGVSIVASDKFEKYKADRGASFSNAAEKLERWLGIWNASGAILLPSIMILGVEPDGFLDQATPGFAIRFPLYDLARTSGKLEPVDWREINPAAVADVPDPTDDIAALFTDESVP